MKGRIAVGVDIGGTSAKLGLVDESPAIVARADIPTSGTTPEQLAREVIEGAHRLVESIGNGAEIAVIGIGCAGLIDTEAGIVRRSPNLIGWENVALGDLLAAEAGVRVSLINDANAFGWAEGVHGPGARARVGIYVTLGTGVGGCLLVDGRFFETSHGLAGEIGHMSVHPDGPSCLCGGRGCLETFVGSARIVELAERKIESGAPGGAIRSASGGPDSVITPKAIAEAAADGDWTARSVFEDVGAVLGSAMASVANLLDPDVIVVGGGVAQAGAALFGPMRAAYARQAIAPPDVRAALSPAHFGADAGLVGSATYARDHA